MFRQTPRSPASPSSFPSGLQPVASKDLNGSQQHRLSRTDLNFEQALHSQDTFLIREGVDVNTLGAGADTSFSSSLASPSTHPHTPQIGVQPATPTVMPPTPTPTNHGAGPSSAQEYPSPSIQNDTFYNPEDRDYQTKRRSMYRSPGSASSPDLATLLKKKKRQESPLPPNKQEGMFRSEQSTARVRTTSSTPSSTSSPSNRGKYRTERFGNGTGVHSAGWIVTDPHGAQESGSPKKQAKQSVRAKTSAFLNKMMGTATIREKSTRTYSNAPSTPTTNSRSVFDAFPPPVPPLPPSKHNSVGISGSDVFSDSSSGPDISKPLPLIRDVEIHRDSGESNASSMVVVESFQSKAPPSPLRIPRDHSADLTSKMGKRRSMSVSDAEIKKQLASTFSPGRTSEEHNGLPGWAGIFTELSDPNSLSSLALRDPSTPDKRTFMNRSKSDSMAFPSVDYPVFKSTLTSPISTDTLTVKIEPPSMIQESPLSSRTFPSPAEHPPRSSSLQTPPGSIRNGRPGPRFGPRPNWNGSVSAGGYSSSHANSPSREEKSLRAQHRSNASNSEPSLIPHEDDGLEHNRAVRLTPSTSSFMYSETASSVMSPITPDVSTGDLLSARFRSTPPGQEEPDIESKAKTLAARCWNEDEEFLAKEKIAEWLGGHGRVNGMALAHWMENFDFSGLRLDVAFRRLCAKLFLKAETQQVDRILEAFANRYFVCNPSSILRSPSVVHAVAYSLLLLNTDLHVAELQTRMSRNQFVRNTLSAIQMQLQSNSSNSDLDANSVRQGSDCISSPRRTKRSDSITSWNSITRDGIMSLGASLPAAANGTKSGNGSTSSFPASNGESKSPEPVVAVLYDRAWESEMETMLKEVYTAIKHQQVLQPLGSSLAARSSTSSLTPHGPLMRVRSGRGPPDRLTTLKRGSIRGLQSILGTPNGVSPYSSSGSVDGRISPAPSFATSEVTGSSASFLTPTLGFASNLSHTIIREAQEDDDHSVHSHETGSTTISITDEELALLGAPWAKEGMLCRKQFWEVTGKKAKSRSWMDVFVVIQKGELNMFIFGDRGHGSSGVVGGGNWLENAQPVGTLLLTHALAHVLPPPGYNRQRPHCMVLTLANGGVYFFQAGTEELVNEWVSTCNYWAARQSKEPLAGGVSNMEYGWNRVVDSRGPPISEEDPLREPDRSDAISVRSSRSRYAASIRSAHSPWADRLFINDWKQPLHPTVPSMHDEETQLEALQKHVVYLSTDLQEHNELRAPMATLYTPRSTNASKSLTNWENKSKYLLSEIVKYQSYIDSLQNAMALRLKKRGEKALERALRKDDDDERLWTVHPDDETVQDHGELPRDRSESDLITPTATLTRLHHREVAQGGEDDYHDV